MIDPLVRLRSGTSMHVCRSRKPYLISLLLFVLPVLMFGFWSQSVARADGTWTKITNNPPGPIDTCYLLTDGRIMCHDAREDTANTKRNWYVLTPDSTGSYVAGKWTAPGDIALLPGTYSPLYYAGAVLADGRLVIVGGEYNSGNPADTNLGAVYNPVTNTWAVLTPPTTGPVGDAQGTVLPSGKFLVSNQFGTGSFLLDPLTLTWTTIGKQNKADDNSEEGWTLLPDGSLLTVDCQNGKVAERYIPGANPVTTGNWVTAGTTPSLLPDNGGMGIVPEMGAGVLTPFGKVFETGASGHNATYDVATGVWTAAPDFPAGGRAADGPSALLTNGRVLTSASPFFDTPAHWFEYDSVANTLTAVTDKPNSNFDSTFYTRMLPLPNGQVMVTDSDVEVYVYTPKDPAFQEAWRPTIATVLPNLVAGSVNNPISGTQFNGLSEATNYGDDASNATNYPLVRLTSLANGRVTYCRTHGHSTMGVATGGASVSTLFDVPAKDSSGIPLPDGQYNLEVVANGIPSVATVVTFGTTAPTANSQSVNVAHNTAASITLTGSDPNTPPQSLTFAIGTSPAHGTLSGFNATSGAVTYTPNAGYQGSDSFTFTVTNTSNVTSNIATVSLTVAPAVPVANGQSVTTNQNTAVAVTLTGNDGDDNPALSLTYVVTANPAHGTLTGTAPNLTYTPNAGYFGADSFQFKVNNGVFDSSVATVNITVIGAPTANSQSVNVAHNTAKAITLTGSDPNTPPQSLTFSVATGPAHGTLSGTAPNLTYTPNAGYQGTDSFTFTVKNTSGLTSATATVTLNVAPAVPVANGQTVNTPQNTAVGITLTGTDGDDNPALPLTYMVTANPAHGTLTGTAPNLTYTPNAGYIGSDSFQFKVNNGVFDSSAATVNINVTDATAPTVVSYRVLFGSTSYNLIGSNRFDLPWQITGIQVVFSKPIATGDASSLTGVSASGLSGLGTNTLTWSISPLTIGSFNTSLLGTGVHALKDSSGNALATFSQSFKVLYGDFNGDGFVTSTDMVGVNAATVAPYNIFADIDGNGVVNVADVQVVRSRLGTKL